MKMLTYKLKIKNNIDISDYCKDYSFLFRKLYANFELSADKHYQKELQAKYGLDSWFFESCKTEVKMKLSQNETQRKKQLLQIQSIEKELLNNNFEGKKGKRKKFYLTEKLGYLKEKQAKKITFGGLSNLQKISFLSNEKEENQEELSLVKAKYYKQRIIPIYSIGEAPQKSNRKFSFDFLHQQILFKPDKNTKIAVDFHCSKNQLKNLEKLQTYIGIMPVSVRLDNDFVWISFDEEKLNNYEFKQNEYFRELKNLSKQENTKELRKEIYKKFITEQRERKLINKLNNRYLAVDLNPEFIGFCVVDKAQNGEINEVYKECLDLSNLNTKTRLSSTDKKQIKQNNKRKFELCEAWRYIFELATHFKVAYFVSEELEFKAKSYNENSTIANYKTKNIWHRTLTTNLINKYCNSLGIEKIGVIAAYSSFIGNIQHIYFDPISASLEIARRGTVKYDKGSSIFPVLSDKDKDTMCLLGLDVPCDTVLNWKNALGLLATSGLRYRRVLEKSEILDKNLSSYKSGIKIYHFV